MVDTFPSSETRVSARTRQGQSSATRGSSAAQHQPVTGESHPSGNHPWPWNMLFRHSTLLPASAERPSRFRASAARYTARGNTCKWTLATLLPANLSRRVVEEVVDHHLVPPDERTSGAQSAGAIEAFSAPQMFPPQSSGRPRRVLRIHVWKVIGVNISCTVGKGMDG